MQHRKTIMAHAAKTLLIPVIIVILSMQWTNAIAVCAYAQETEIPDTAEDKTVLTETGLNGFPSHGTGAGTIEEADLNDQPGSDSERSHAVPERKNREINGFLNIFFQWEPGGAGQTVKLFCSGTDSYVFLPSFADSKSLHITFDENEFALWISDEPVENGGAFRKAELNKDYLLTVQFKEKETASDEDEAEYGFYTLRLMRSENLPAVYVETFNGTMEYIDQQKQNYEPGSLLCVNANGSLDALEEIKKIHLRGSYSLTKEQKSYTVVLQEDADLLGLGTARKWALIGSGGDPTRLRNPVSYSLAQDLGLPYAVEYRLVDLYCNGEYHGLTLLAEPIEVTKNRIEPEAADALLEAQNEASRLEDDSVFFTTPDRRFMEILYPETLSDSEAAAVRDAVNEIYHKIERCDTSERYHELCKTMDMESFAISYLISALTNDLDRNDYSTFYYLLDGKLYAGPVWDFDHAYGGLLNERSCDYRINAYPVGPAERLMLKSKSFRSYIREIALEREDAVDALKERLPELAKDCRNSLEMTCIRFPELMDLDADFGDFDLNLSYLQNSLEERVDYIWDAILHPDDYCRLVLSSGRIGWIRKGETLTEDLLQSICKIQSWDTITYINGQEVRLDLPVTGDLPLTGFSKDPEDSDT